MSEIVQIRNVEHTGRRTGSGDPILKVTLADGREGAAFDAKFIDLDLLDTFTINVRRKPDFNGKPDYVFNLENEGKPVESTGQFESPVDSPMVKGLKEYLSKAPEEIQKVEFENVTTPGPFVIDKSQELGQQDSADFKVQKNIEPETKKTEPKAKTSSSPVPWINALEQAQLKFLSLTGQETEAKIEAGFAFQAMEENPTLQQCDPGSIQNAIIQIARTGMTLNPALQLAHLIPRTIKGTLKCCLEFTYRGYVKILKDYGCVRDIQAIIVYEDEEYEEGISQTDRPVHKKAYAKSEAEDNKREVKGVYCRVILPQDNLTIFTQFTPYWKIQKAENMSPGKNKEGSAWKNWRPEMIGKTKIKADFKTLISGSPNTKALAALEIEHESEEFTPVTVTHSKTMRGVPSKSKMATLALSKATPDEQRQLDEFELPNEIHQPKKQKKTEKKK